MRADRLVAALLVLQAKGRVTARQLAVELEVSEKTARRDLEALSMAGFPVYPQVGRGGGWQLIGRGTTDLTGLTATEARALFLAAGTSGSITSDTSSALRKLMQALPETFRDTAEAAASAIVVDRTTWSGRTPPPPVHLDVLQHAVIDRRRVVLGYVDRAEAATERWVDPLGLVSKGFVWYLVGNTARGLRTFRVERVRGVELTDQPATRPDGFDLREAWQQVIASMGERRSAVRATVRVPTDAVTRLRRQFGPDMLLAELGDADQSGQQHVIVGGPSAEAIAEHLAGWGRVVEVLDPPAVRDHLLRIGRELSATYS